MRFWRMNQFNRWLAHSLLLGLLGQACSLRAAEAEPHWVATWGCAPQLVEPNNLPPVPLANTTLRQFIHVSRGGQRLRVRFSNRFGTDPVTIRAAHLALAASRASAGNGEINPATDQLLAFQGAAEVQIPPGETVDSDPVELAVPALEELAVSVYLGAVSATTVTGHPGSRTTSFLMAGNTVSAAVCVGANTTAHWYLLTGVDVLADPASRAVVAFGDSITDGRGSTTDGNNRWSDFLARRLSTNAATSGMAVVNMGIGGNALFGGLGPAGVERFERDVLEQPGAGYVVLFEGVNDIGDHKSDLSTATNLIRAYSQLAAKARAKGLRIYGATLTPFGGNGYYSELHEQERQIVNAWWRTNTICDGILDFDAAVRDPTAPTNLLPAYFPGLNANDGLHLNPAGYAAMGAAIDLKLFVPQ